MAETYRNGKPKGPKQSNTNSGAKIESQSIHHPNPWPDLVTFTHPGCCFCSSSCIFCVLSFPFFFQKQQQHWLFAFRLVTFCCLLFMPTFHFYFARKKLSPVCLQSEKPTSQMPLPVLLLMPCSCPILPFHLQMALEHFIARQSNGNVPKSVSWLWPRTRARTRSHSLGCSPILVAVWGWPQAWPAKMPSRIYF